MEKKAITTKVAELLMTDAKDILLMLGIETEFDYEERSGMVYFTSKPISMTPRMFFLCSASKQSSHLWRRMVVLILKAHQSQ